jgi:hypothetical protein
LEPPGLRTKSPVIDKKVLGKNATIFLILQAVDGTVFKSLSQQLNFLGMNKILCLIVVLRI